MVSHPYRRAHSLPPYGGYFIRIIQAIITLIKGEYLAKYYAKYRNIRFAFDCIKLLYLWRVDLWLRVKVET